MREVALRLFGTPCLLIDGREEVVSPRKAFELLALLALAPDGRLLRTQVAETLWPNVEQSAQFERLRPCLSRLKKEIERLELGPLIAADSHAIMLPTTLASDVGQFLASDQRALCPSVLQPVMVGWNGDVARPVRRAVETHLASGLTCDNRPWTPDDVAIARSFLDLYPANPQVAGRLYGWLQQTGDLAAASDLVTHFEEAWIDEYGYVDTPDLTALTGSLFIPPDQPSKVKGTLTRRALLVGGLSAAALGTFAFLNKVDVDGPLRLTVRERLNIGGTIIEVIDVAQSRTTTYDSFHLAYDGSLIASSADNSGQKAIVLWQGVTPTTRPIGTPNYLGLNDKDGRAELTGRWVRDRIMTVYSKGTDEVVLAGENLQGKVIPATRKDDHAMTDARPGFFLTDEVFTFQHYCQDSDSCHRRTFVYDHGKIRPLFELDKTPQVDVVMFQRGDALYGVLTYGFASNWANEVFRTRGNQVELLGPGNPVGLVEEDRVLVHFTDKDDLFSCFWNYPAEGGRLEPWGGPRLREIRTLGPFIIARRYSVTDKYVAFDATGTEVPALAPFLRGVNQVTETRDRSAVFCRRKEGGWVIWTMLRVVG
ncbi:MAG: hypothetical protein K1X67_02975 [Fimbriimonadaceae bacterium]|nr:hypothetical protein [Fimbriimonadaceae bacterium]